MDHPLNPTEEAAESVSPGKQGLPASDLFESIKSESQVSAKPNEALVRISQDMTRVLERLTAPKALIDMVRRHKRLRNSMGQIWKSPTKRNLVRKVTKNIGGS